jgi:hypothetical protein
MDERCLWSARGRVQSRSEPAGGQITTAVQGSNRGGSQRAETPAGGASRTDWRSNARWALRGGRWTDGGWMLINPLLSEKRLADRVSAGSGVGSEACGRSAHPFGGLAASRAGGPWLCVPASRRVCRFEDEEVSSRLHRAGRTPGAGRARASFYRMPATVAHIPEWSNRRCGFFRWRHQRLQHRGLHPGSGIYSCQLRQEIIGPI